MPPKPPLIEVVACTADDASRAEAAGASRIELVSAISEGGLTPSAGALLETKSRCALPVMAMLRPRGGGFAYTEAEFQTLLRDAEILLSLGADGLVFGALDEGTIDEGKLRQVLALAKSRPVTFHRAFDLLPDPLESLERLAGAGVARILTRGGPARIDPERIRQYRDHAAGKVGIIACGGIRTSNAAAIVRASGAEEIHLGPFRVHGDHSAGSATDTTLVEHLTLDEEEVRGVAQRV